MALPCLCLRLLAVGWRSGWEMKLPLFALFITAFAIGTAEFVVAGLLPQVAVENQWSAEEFLNQTCKKAGLDPAAWKDPKAVVEVFSAQVFAEREFKQA